MKLILHDLTQDEFNTLAYPIDNNTTVVSDNGSIHHCIGCFGCWIKTPGICVLKDGYGNMGELISKCHELIIISKCVYGCYSPFVKNVLDRCIPYLLPYFVTINGETHHQKRYENDYRLSVFFYGDNIIPVEQETAKVLVQANAINLYAKENQVHFCKDLNSLRRDLA